MVTNEQTLQDLVCGMRIPRNQYAIDYLGMHFAFCSLQCKERFLANPHLYIGEPGQKSPKQEGRKVIKRRRFQLTEPLTDTMAAHVSDEIRSMMGIKQIIVNGAMIEITYDLLEATAEQIESRLETIGASLGYGWGQQLRLGFAHFLEETELDSLEVPPSTHLHNH
jgi:YHS domain-containing protein